jgi:hypothetical protein
VNPRALAWPLRVIRTLLAEQAIGLLRVLPNSDLLGC